MTDLRRDLSQRRGRPAAAGHAPTTRPRRTCGSRSLNRFTDNEWSAGDRDVPDRPTCRRPDARARRASPPTRAAHGRTTTTSTVLRDVRLDLAAHAGADQPDRGRRATGATTPSTMDFIAGSDDLTTARLHYSMTGVQLDLAAADLADAPRSSAAWSSTDYTELPTGIPADGARPSPTRSPGRRRPASRRRSRCRTGSARTAASPTPLHAPPGNGTDDLVALPQPGPRRPHRLLRAVRLGDGGDGPDARHPRPGRGRLPRARRRSAPGTWVYSSHDLHAWPELFFPGAGWVRFEPTPAGRRPASVPAYTTQQVPVGQPRPAARRPRPAPRRAAVPRHRRAPRQAPASRRRRRRRPGVRRPVVVAGGARRRPGVGGSWSPAAAAPARPAPAPPRAAAGRRPRGGVGRAARHRARPRRAVAATAARRGRPATGLVRPLRRARRREHRRAAARTARTSPPTPSPRSTGSSTTLELLRYARDGGRPARHRCACDAETQTCLEALHGGAPRSARRRADWWPRSVLSRSRARGATGRRAGGPRRTAASSTTWADRRSGSRGRTGVRA